MRVFVFGIVVNVGGTNVVPQDLETFADGTHHVRVSEIEADANVIEVRAADHFDQAIRSGKLVRDVLQKDPNPERFGERAQVLDRSHGSFEFLLAEVLISGAQVLDEEAERN